MNNCYVVTKSRSHVFYLDRRLKDMGVFTEIVGVPRDIKESMCDLGVRFRETDLETSINVLKWCGRSNYKVYKEIPEEEGRKYTEINCFTM